MGFLDEETEDDTDGFLDDELGSSDLDNTTKDSDNDTIAQKGYGDDYTPQIHFKSSENMSEVGDESVHLIVTSPPYNADWDYGSHDDDKAYREEYLRDLAKVFRECYRVLVPGGRMCVNVPSLLRSGASGGYPIAADITRMLVAPDAAMVSMKGEDYLGQRIKLHKETDFIIREQIAWYKGFNTDGLAPNGSFPRPWGVLLNNMHEVVLIFQKPGKREYDDMSDERIEDSKIDKRNDDLCDDVWHISPETFQFKHADGEDVPVFPEELVRRCVTIWSYKGDTILDPYAGRFTVGKVAMENDRHSIGYEIREEIEQDIRRYTGMDNAGINQW